MMLSDTVMKLTRYLCTVGSSFCRVMAAPTSLETMLISQRPMIKPAMAPSTLSPKVSKMG